MSTVWIVYFTILLTFCILFNYVGYRIGRAEGFKMGANEVLRQWKDSINNGGM